MPSPKILFTKRCPSCGYRFEADLTECPVDASKLGKDRPEVGVLGGGTYRLVGRLGVGGMGAVYKAINDKVGRSVAIKMLHLSLKSDRTVVNRFFQEARAVNKIRHPNVVEIYDLVSGDDDLYMVMEFLRGKDVRQILEETRTPLPPERAVHILEQVCGALYATHEQGIIHRDLKPENVFVTRRNEIEDFVKLLDFGVAKLELPDGRLTRDGVALGTPQYMSPEQARGAPMDHRTDIYALGCIAYEMLTLQSVFTGEAAADIMIKHVKQAPKPLRYWNSSIPERLEATVLRCLAKSPDARPANGLELAQELSSAIGKPFDTTGAFMNWRDWSTVSGVYDISATMAAIRTSVSVNPVRRQLQNLARSSKRRYVAASGAVAAVALTGLVVWGASGRRPRAHVDMPRPTAVIAVAEAQDTEAPDTGRVRLQSSPPGATLVDEQGRTLGVAPHDITVPVGEQRRIRFELPGYRSVERVFRIEADSTVAVSMYREEESREDAVAERPGVEQTAPRGRRAKFSRAPQGDPTTR